MMDDSTRKMSEAVLSRIDTFRRNSMNFMSKVPSIYYEFASSPYSNVSSMAAAAPMSYITLKPTKDSAFSDSCSSTANASSSTTMDGASSSNSTITSRTSIMQQTIKSHANSSTDRRNHSKPIRLVRPAIKEGEKYHEELMFKESNTSKEDDSCFDDVDDDGSVKTRSLNLNWDTAQAVARRGRNTDLMHLNGMKQQDNNDSFLLPLGITANDIMVTIDIDDEARFSSRVDEMTEEDMDVTPRRQRCDTDTTSCTSIATNQTYRNRRRFEEAVRQGILDDLQSVYTANTNTAKLVLCIVICVLSDGTLQDTFWSGGRVGLAQIGLNWRLFDADDLKVYEGGLSVQRKDFGFGPLELTSTEGQYYLVSKLAPRAANDIIRRMGECNEKFLVEL